MVDKLGSYFGSSATSARTSKDLRQHTPLDLGDAAADTATTANATTHAHADRTVPRDVTSAQNVSERAHEHHDDTCRLDSRPRGASSWLNDSRATSLTDGISAGARSSGGCGRDFERTDLAGDLAGSGGLQTAATTEEEFTAADRQGGHVSSNSGGSDGGISGGAPAVLGSSTQQCTERWQCAKQQQQCALQPRQHTHTQPQPSAYPSDVPGGANSTSSNGGGSGSGSMPVTPSARSERANRREIFVSRQRAALEQYEKLEEQQQTALSSPSTPAMEREIEGIKGELQRITMRQSPSRQQLPMTEREECLLVAAATTELAAAQLTAVTADSAAAPVEMGTSADPKTAHPAAPAATVEPPTSARQQQEWQQVVTAAEHELEALEACFEAATPAAAMVRVTAGAAELTLSAELHGIEAQLLRVPDSPAATAVQQFCHKQRAWLEAAANEEKAARTTPAAATSPEEKAAVLAAPAVDTAASAALADLAAAAVLVPAIDEATVDALAAMNPAAAAAALALTAPIAVDSAPGDVGAAAAVSMNPAAAAVNPAAAAVGDVAAAQPTAQAAVGPAVAATTGDAAAAQLAAAAAMGPAPTAACDVEAAQPAAPAAMDPAATAAGDVAAAQPAVLAAVDPAATARGDLAVAQPAAPAAMDPL